MSLHSGFTISQSDFTITSQHLFQFTLGSELVFHLTVVSPNTKYSQSVQNMFSSHHCRHLTGLTLIHQFTNSPWVHIDLHTRTQMLSFWSAECEPTVGRTRVERTQSQGLEVNELFSVLPTSCPWNAHRRIKLTIHPSGSIFPVFIAPALFALWDHA